jgi:hypothetical protein
VNALLGGVIHAAVDPNTGNVYYVYGNRDAITGNNRIAIRRLQPVLGAFNTILIGPEHFVTGQVQAAIPSVAVANNGVVGVFYYTFNGIDSGFPQFSAHLSLSQNGGETFTDRILETFLSPATDNGDPRQRVLGDYMQLKALGGTFMGPLPGMAFHSAGHSPTTTRFSIDNRRTPTKGRQDQAPTTAVSMASRCALML